MKKVFGLFVAVVAVLAMASCGGGSNTPKGVAEQFIKAIQDKDGEKMASHWCTIQTAKLPQAAPRKTSWRN